MTSTATGPGDRDQGPGSGAWFDRWATQYDAERRLLISPFDAYYAAAAEAAALLPGGARRTTGSGGGPIRVLDLGAGTGLLTAALAEALPGAHLTLLDEAEGMLAQARDRLARRTEGELELIVGDLLADMPPGPFDVIASGLAIHHLDPRDQARTYAAAQERLAPGGVFVNAEQLHARARRGWRITTSNANWSTRAPAASRRRPRSRRGSAGRSISTSIWRRSCAGCMRPATRRSTASSSPGGSRSSLVGDEASGSARRCRRCLRMESDAFLARAPQPVSPY